MASLREKVLSRLWQDAMPSDVESQYKPERLQEYPIGPQSTTSALRPVAVGRHRVEGGAAFGSASAKSCSPGHGMSDKTICTDRTILLPF